MTAARIIGPARDLTRARGTCGDLRARGGEGRRGLEMRLVDGTSVLISLDDAEAQVDLARDLLAAVLDPLDKRAFEVGRLLDQIRRRDRPPAAVKLPGRGWVR